MSDMPPGKNQVDRQVLMGPHGDVKMKLDKSAKIHDDGERMCDESGYESDRKSSSSPGLVEMPPLFGSVGPPAPIATPCSGPSPMQAPPSLLPLPETKNEEGLFAGESYLKFLELRSQNQMGFWNTTKSGPLPPVVLPLPICCKASPLGPKQARRYSIPKYAVGFVIGPNGYRIQASRDVSGANILLLGDQDVHHAYIGVFGTEEQIHDAVYLMKLNILRHSGMFIGDIDGMLKLVPDSDPIL